VVRLFLNGLQITGGGCLLESMQFQKHMRPP
jgi:hypothetical protein